MSLRTPALLLPSHRIALVVYGRPQPWLTLWRSVVAAWRGR